MCNTNNDFFDNLISDELLINLLNKKQAEVFENIIFKGKRRYYIEDLTQRSYNLENTTPYQLKIYDNVIEANSWGLLLSKTVKFLLSVFPFYEQLIYNFKCSWTNSIIFSTTRKTNYKKINDTIYINCNHTALHSCWLLQDILDFFKIDKSLVLFLIHRPSGSEPPEVLDYITKRAKNKFIEYMFLYNHKDTAYSERVYNNIDKYINKILCKVSKSYTNIFLFDDNATMHNYVTKIRRVVDFNCSDKNKRIFNKYLDWIIEFYKYI